MTKLRFLTSTVTRCTIIATSYCFCRV